MTYSSKFSLIYERKPFAAPQLNTDPYPKPQCLTFVCVVEGSEGDREEGGGVLAGVDQMREGTLGVTVTPQALHKAEPGGQALDHCPYAI